MAIIENTSKRTANPMYNLLVVLIRGRSKMLLWLVGDNYIFLVDDCRPALLVMYLPSVYTKP